MCLHDICALMFIHLLKNREVLVCKDNGQLKSLLLRMVNSKKKYEKFTGVARVLD